MQTTQVYEVNPNDLSNIRDHLINNFPSFEVVDPSPNVVWRLRAEKGGISAYSSGKLVVQLDSELVREVGQKLSDFIDPALLNEGFLKNGLSSVFVPHVGVDESGKGDYFGSLVVAAVYVGLEEYEKLKDLGIQDSKKISDSKIIKLAESIKSVCKYYEVLIISPLEYVNLYKRFNNVNKLLAYGHSCVIESVLGKTPSEFGNKVLIDQFAKSKNRVIDALKEKDLDVDLLQMHKGERDFAVAAASILAREGFINDLSEMGDKYGVTFPKGASYVIDFAREFVEHEGFDELKNVAKINFRTTSQL